jgi:hypothetical protein
MADRMQDGGGTKVEQAERAEQERTEPVEPERRPTYKTLDEQQGRLTEAEERFERGRRSSAWSSSGGSARRSRSRSPGWSGCACA